MKQLPNLLSCLRILIALLLLPLIEYPFFFAAGYLLCGITDIADGYVARKWQVESKSGAILDSVGDFVFWSILLFLLFFRLGLSWDSWLIVGILVIAVARLLNLLMTKVKFHEWAVIHSLANKATGLVLFFLLMVVFLERQVHPVLAAPVLALAFLSSVEECLILLTSASYDVNRKSLFLKSEETGSTNKSVNS